MKTPLEARTRRGPWVAWFRGPFVRRHLAQHAALPGLHRDGPRTVPRPAQGGQEVGHAPDGVGTLGLDGRCCSSKRCGRLQARTRLRGCCAGWPIRASLRRYGTCTVILRVRGQWPSWRRKPLFRARPFSSASGPPWACPQWNTSSLAHGRGERSAPPPRVRGRRDRRTRRLRLGQCLQHRVQPARWPVSQSICAARRVPGRPQSAVTRLARRRAAVQLRMARIPVATPAATARRPKAR